VTVKYEIKSYGKDRIVAINCVKETEKTLWIEIEWRGRVSISQRRKCSDFHDTWQSAYDHLVATAQLKVDIIERNLHHAKVELAEIEALSEPQPPTSRIAPQPIPTQVP
jgi:hypothetical protein